MLTTTACFRIFFVAATSRNQDSSPFVQVADLSEPSRPPLSCSHLQIRPSQLQATLKAQSRFHDPTRSSLHSHTQSSSAFLSWSSSTSNPSLSRPTTPPQAHQYPHQPFRPFDDSLAFTVKASLADEEVLAEGEVLKDGGDGVRFRESRVEGLVTPPVDKGGRRVRYCVLEVSFGRTGGVQGVDELS